VIEKQCARCGKRFTAERSSRRYCGTSCRAEASKERRREGAVVPLRPGAAALTPALRALIATHELDDTDLAQQALVLAARIDSGMESGNAVAALSRELRAVRAELLANVADPDSRVQRLQDELAERRRARA